MDYYYSTDYWKNLRSALLISFALFILLSPILLDGLQHGMKLRLGTRDERSYFQYTIQPVKIPVRLRSKVEPMSSEQHRLALFFFLRWRLRYALGSQPITSQSRSAAISILFIHIVQCDNTRKEANPLWETIKIISNLPRIGGVIPLRFFIFSPFRTRQRENPRP